MRLKKEIDSFKVHQEELLKYASNEDIYKGKIIPGYYVNHINTKKITNKANKIEEHTFYVRDYLRRYEDYRQTIQIKENTLYNCKCNCDEFKKNKKCYHIVSVLYRYANLIYDDKYDENLLYKDFLSRYQIKANKKIKKEVKVEIEINLSKYERSNGEYMYMNDIKAQIGENKLYSLLNHASGFFEVYNSTEGECKFGKNFTYNPEEHFFTQKSERTLKELEDFIEDKKYNYSKAYKKLIEFMHYNNIPFKVNKHNIENIIEGSPLESKIKKEGQKYIIDFNYKELYPITNDYSYIYYYGEVYHLNNNERNVLEDIFDNELEQIKVSQKELDIFTNGLLKVIKNNTIVDESAQEDIKINKLSNIELYFDLSRAGIKAKIIYDYKGIKINHFDTKEKITRDEEKENEVIENLIKYGFTIDKKTIELNDINQEVEFIENGLEELANEYKIYTTDKFDNMKIKKKTSVQSTFGIGKDNIFSYDFNLDGIQSDELVNIFKEMKTKKKYYRLKNGDILNLEDENLKELEDLTDELNFTDEEIINGKGTIQKYRAIYLDSLKNTKYKNVKTNNLFSEFINNFYEYKNKEITIEEKEMSILRDYQKIGVKWLYNIHKTGFGGILADEMGLGKTIQTIYYIKQILKENKENKTLIVVPTSLVYNWKHEFTMYGKEIKVVVISGQREIRRKQINSDSQVIITSYGMLREDEEYYKDKKFHSMFIDEAQSIKNYVAGITKVVKKIDATTKFALTGTPLENSPLELWSIFDYIMPGYLGNIMTFKTKYKINDFNDTTNKLLDSLNKQIRPFILRRKKQDVIKDLPEKIENNIYVELTDKQKKIYVAELEKTKKKIEEMVKNGESKKIGFMILPLLTKLRQVCIDPKIVYEDYDGGSNKIDTLLYVLKENIENNHKVLMFTSFKDALNIVANKLEEENIPYYTISGEVSSLERIKRVEEFNNKEKPAVFLIMLKAGGTGLNLASASTVIHLDLWWNPQAENQATDRAHRIGQKNTVEVMHIITKGTIEEKILELQKKKLKLSEKLIDGEIRDKDIVSTLTEKEIRELLSNENKD